MTRRRWGLAQWGLVGLLLVGWGLRVTSAFQGALHSDEALYGYWGLLIGSGRDPWLTSVPVYKPPLLPYAISLLQLLLGKTTVALRLLGLVSGLAVVPLVYALARALYRDRWIGVSAGTAMALSPFAVASSGTAFPDLPMVALGLGACLAAARDRRRWAGLLAGLSFATKQTGLVWFPLALGLLLGRNDWSGRRVRGFVLAYLGPAVLVLGWDAVRIAREANSFWSAGVAGYGGLRLIWPHELWPRLWTWWQLARTWFESPVVHALLLFGPPFLVWRAVLRHEGTWSAFFDLLLVSFCLIYLWLHWLVAFPPWGRYLLPLVPLAAILLGRILQELISLWPTRRGGGLAGAIAPLLLALLLVVPAYHASAAGAAQSREQPAYQGIDAVISYFSDLPEGSVVYHHWLGWHYHYGLFDAPVYLAYWPTPEWLAQDVQAFGRREPRYIAFPGWESSVRVETVLEEIGYRLEPVDALDGQGSARTFAVYRILPSSCDDAP